jgi:hypothetical protein
MGRPGCSGCCEHEDQGCEFTPTIKFWHKNRDDDLVQGYTPEEYKGEFGDQAVDRRMLEVGDIVKWQEQPNALVVDNEWEIMDTNLPNENSYDLRNVQDRTIRKVNIGRWFLLMLRPLNPDRPDTRFELPDFKGISVEFEKPHKKLPPEMWHDGTMNNFYGDVEPEGYYVSFIGDNQVWQIIDNRGRNDLGLVEFEIQLEGGNRKEIVTENDIDFASEDYEKWYWNINTDENGDLIDPVPHPNAPAHPEGLRVQDRVSGVRTGCAGPFFNFGDEKGDDTSHTEKAVPNDIPLSHLAKLPDPKALQNSNEIFVAGGWLMRASYWGDYGLAGWSEGSDRTEVFDFMLHEPAPTIGNGDSREEVLADILREDTQSYPNPVYTSYLYDGEFSGLNFDAPTSPVWNSFNYNAHPIPNEDFLWYRNEHYGTQFVVEDTYYSKVVNQAVYFPLDENNKRIDSRIKWLEVVQKGNPFLSLDLMPYNYSTYTNNGNINKLFDKLRDFENLFTHDIGYIAPYGSYCINKDIVYMDYHSYYSDWTHDFYATNNGIYSKDATDWKAYKVKGSLNPVSYTGKKNLHVKSGKLYLDGNSYTIDIPDFNGTIEDWDYQDQIKSICYFWPSRAASKYTFAPGSPFPDPKDDNYKYYNLYQANPGYFEGKFALGAEGADLDSDSLGMKPTVAGTVFADGYMMNPRQLNDYRGAEDDDPITASDWQDTKRRDIYLDHKEEIALSPYELVRNAKPRDHDVSHGSIKLREYFDDAEKTSEFKKQFWCQWSSHSETDNRQIIKVSTVDTHEKGEAIHGELWSWTYFIKVFNALDSATGYSASSQKRKEFKKWYLSGGGRGEQITGINIGGDKYWENVTGEGGNVKPDNYAPKDELEVGDFFFSKFDFKQDDEHDIEEWLVPLNHPKDYRQGLIDFGLNAVEQYLWKITEIVEGVGYRATPVIGGGNPKVFARSQMIISVNQDNRSLACLSAIKELDNVGSIDINKITIDGKIAWEVKGDHLQIHWPHLKIKNIRLIEKLAKQSAKIEDANFEPYGDLLSMRDPHDSYLDFSSGGRINNDPEQLANIQARIAHPFEQHYSYTSGKDTPISAFAFLVKGTALLKSPFYAISGNVKIIYDLDTIEEVRE